MNVAASSIHSDINPLTLLTEQRDALIISSRMVDGHCVIVSRYGDLQWRTINHPTNKAPAEQTINFGRLPESFRETMKSIAYRYMHRGREGQKRPAGQTQRDAAGRNSPGGIELHAGESAHNHQRGGRGRRARLLPS